MVESEVTATRRSFALLSSGEGLEAAVSAWVADERNRVSGQELPEEEAAAHAELVQEAEKKELGA